MATGPPKLSCSVKGSDIQNVLLQSIVFRTPASRSHAFLSLLDQRISFPFSVMLLKLLASYKLLLTAAFKVIFLDCS